MTTSIASDGRWSVAAAENPAGHETRISGRTERSDARRPLQKLVGGLDDAVMLLLVVLLAPLAILVIGTPVALFVRLLIEIAQRM